VDFPTYRNKTANITIWVGQHAGILSKPPKTKKIRGGSSCRNSGST
jgi:hypothetical protein